MANVFRNYPSRAIGTTNTAVFTGPATAQTTVIGVTIANILSNSIEVDLFLSVSGSNTYIVKSATIVKGGSLVPVGGDQKLVVEEGEILYVVSNTASSVDVVVSTLELTP